MDPSLMGCTICPSIPVCLCLWFQRKIMSSYLGCNTLMNEDDAYFSAPLQTIFVFKFGV